MAFILNIETSATICSVALSKDGALISSKESAMVNTHSSLLTVFIDALFRASDIKYEDLDAISVSKGPGSYTGLRIGVAVAKGIAYGINKPLISVGTLQAMANKVSAKIYTDKDAWYCPMIDARRMEVYTGFFDSGDHTVVDISADIITELSYNEYLWQRKVIFFGNGSDKCRKIIIHPNAVFLENIYLSAVDMIDLSEKAYQNNLFEDVAYFEPFYLKDFVATIPRKNIY